MLLFQKKNFFKRFKTKILHYLLRLDLQIENLKYMKNIIEHITIIIINIYF